MAIRTELSHPDLAAVADAWGLGKLLSYRGLPEGSINTLYRLETDAGHQVLRLSEGRQEQEVVFETRLLAHLAAQRFPAVRLLPRRDGAAFGVVRDRYACVFVWAAGEHLAPRAMTRDQGLEVGRVLGRLHAVAESFDGTLPNRYSPARIRQWVDELAALPAPDDALRQALPGLMAEAALLDALPPADQGVIHADLFPDNVKWVGGRISALLDFEMACQGPYVLDLATCLHAFGWDDDRFSSVRLRAIVDGYVSQRPLSATDKAAFHAWARFSALRFTVSRIRDFHLSTLDDDKLTRKDWRRFRDRLDALVALGADGWLDACGL